MLSALDPAVNTEATFTDARSTLVGEWLENQRGRSDLDGTWKAHEALMSAAWQGDVLNADEAKKWLELNGAEFRSQEGAGDE